MLFKKWIYTKFLIFPSYSISTIFLIFTTVTWFEHQPTHDDDFTLWQNLNLLLETPAKGRTHILMGLIWSYQTISISYFITDEIKLKIWHQLRNTKIIQKGNSIHSNFQCLYLRRLIKESIQFKSSRLLLSKRVCGGICQNERWANFPWSDPLEN